VTNPHVAKAVALSYLTELFKVAGEVMTAEELAEHVFANVRLGHDNYPVVRVIGKNRLAIEFDLDAKPVGSTTKQDEPVELWPAPTLAEDPEGVDEDNLADPDPEPWPLPGEADAAGESDDPQDEPVGESDWMAKGRAAAAKMDSGQG
jgi:hypothetical protein